MGLLAAAVSLAFPPRCASCSAPGRAPLCAACEHAVRWLCDPCCARCGSPAGFETDECRDCREPAPAFRRARAAAAYAGPARDALVAFKLLGERRAARRLAAWMLEAAGALEGDAVAFVPATRASVAARGFNPAEELARRVARGLGLPVVPLLRKVRETADQAGLGRAARRGNLRGAFRARPAPPRVLLVDDVLTTGATADACARALRRAGARQIDVLTFARAV